MVQERRLPVLVSTNHTSLKIWSTGKQSILRLTVQFLHQEPPNILNLKIMTLKCQQLGPTIRSITQILAKKKICCFARNNRKRVCRGSCPYRVLRSHNTNICLMHPLLQLLNLILSNSTLRLSNKMRVVVCCQLSNLWVVYRWQKGNRRNKSRLFWALLWAQAPIRLLIWARKKWQESESWKDMARQFCERKKKEKYQKLACFWNRNLPRTNQPHPYISQWIYRARVDQPNMNQVRVIMIRYATGLSSKNKRHSILNICETYRVF